jgi:hypothetical protein
MLISLAGLFLAHKLILEVGNQQDDDQDHAERGEFTLIEDDGLTLGYQRGEYSEVKLEVAATSDHISLHAIRRGNYPLPYQRIEFVLPPNETRQVTVSGKTWIDSQGRIHAFSLLA